MYRDSRRLRLLLALLILTSFTLITVDYRAGDGTVLGGLRRGAAAVFGPVQRAVTSVVRPIGEALANLGDLGSLKSDVERLGRENAELRGRLRELDDQLRRVEDADRLLDLAGRGRYRIVPARVVGVGAGPFEWTVTIDAGTEDGVREDQTVVNGDGLVGRVLSVGPFTAQVLLAVDAEFSVGARLAGPPGELGFLRGDGLDPMVMQLVNQEARVAKGQGVVTGGEGTFVPGVPIGVVDTVRRRPGDLTVTVEVRPYVRYTALDVLGVIVAPPRTDPRDSLLPTPSPRPTPSPSPSPTPSPVVTPTATPTPTPSR